LNEAVAKVQELKTQVYNRAK